MCHVPAGGFWMGTDPPEGQHNEHPRRRVTTTAYAIGEAPVTNAEFAAFVDGGAYRDPSLWSEAGWRWREQDGIAAPRFWNDDAWRDYLAPDQPVVGVSWYEADAFARWAGRHLPTEMEWEVAARAGQLNDAFGIVWQWTRSSYSPYPGYRAIEGALGEYNGKFMVNQLVLRGSSLATPAGHSRITYRNFFYPFHRWQFTGLRLADYA